MAPFHILSLDGGGIRGAFALGFLEELESASGRPVAECFDLIAGTSTGAITALGLGVGMSAQALVKFYRKHGNNIFHPRELYVPKGWIRVVYPVVKSVLQGRTNGNLDHLFRARYCPHALEYALAARFGERTLGSLEGPRIIVPTVNLTRGETYVFGTPHLPRRQKDRKLRIVDVLLAATAAPTYFPHHVMPDGNAHSDGGLWASNPGILAMAEAQRIRQLCTGPACPPPFDTSDVYLLSIGTGQMSYSLAPPGRDAGSLFWSRHVADVMGTSQVQGAQAPLEFLLGDRYCPINFDLPDDTWSLDDVEHMEEMFELGRQAARAQLGMVSKTFLEHRASSFDQAFQPSYS